MKGKTVVALVLLAIIVALVLLAVEAQRRRDAPPRPEKAMQQQKIKLADVTDPAHFTIVDADTTVTEFQCRVVPETHYWREKKTGVIYAPVIRCISCNKDIPLFPYGPGADPKAIAPSYKCPLCHARALAAPAPRPFASE